ncbi:MAG: LLM class flavin-dependent oxidoreductase [SAR202 cluster bacterium]|nr:LLM class flavin-dependent oxidoreductase [SAR202 cluster bacterium]
MTHTSTKVGVLIGTRGLVMHALRERRAPDASQMLAIAERAEAGGLDSVWVGDSLVSKPRFEPVTALAAIAARTSRVRIGTAVMLPVIRPVVPLAHSLATLDVISNGRVIVGAGVGGGFTPDQKKDYSSAGVVPESRAGRLTEMVQAMKRLWTQDHVTFDGKHIRLDDVTLHPRPIQPGGVPILLGAHHRTGGDAQYRRAARHADGVIGITDSPEQWAEVIARVEDAAAAEGRDPDRLDRVFYLTVNIGRDVPKAAAEADDFLMSYYGVRHWEGRWGPWGPPEAIVERMAAYARAGARHLIVRFASWNQPAQLDAFLSDVVPAFKAMD